MTSANGLVQGVYRFELRVTDNNGAVGKDTMQVTVNAAPPNQAPTANAGLDRNMTLPANIATLVGTGNDPDGTITAYQWTKIAGPASGTITNASSATCSLSNLEVGVYRYELRVTDNLGAYGRDTVQVTVNMQPVNSLPVVNVGGDISIYLPENTVNLAGTVTDTDGFIIQQQWVVISGPSSYIMSGGNTTHATISSLQQGNYKVMLSVTDNNGGTASDTLIISVGSTRIEARETDIVNIYPNPVRSTLNVEINTSKIDRKVSFVLVDMKGGIVLTKEIMLTDNLQHESINVDKLARGNYILRVVSGKEKGISLKVVKL
jgi:hypothetical protein